MSEQEELECQNHANCGEYCYTKREREMVLCEDCLDSFDQGRRDYEELKALRNRSAALQSRLDAAEAKNKQLANYFCKVDHAFAACINERDQLRQQLADHESEVARLKKMSDNCSALMIDANQHLANVNDALRRATSLLERLSGDPIAVGELLGDIDALLSSAEPVKPESRLLTANELSELLAMPAPERVEYTPEAFPPCRADVYKSGQLLGIYDMTKEKAQAICSKATELTGTQYDWNFCGGRVVIKYLPANGGDGEADNGR